MGLSPSLQVFYISSEGTTGICTTVRVEVETVSGRLAGSWRGTDQNSSTHLVCGGDSTAFGVSGKQHQVGVGTSTHDGIF